MEKQSSWRIREVKTIVSILAFVGLVGAGLPASGLSVEEPASQKSTNRNQSNKEQLKRIRDIIQTPIEQTPDKSGEIVVPIFKASKSLLRDGQVSAVRKSIEEVPIQLRKALALTGCIVVIVHASNSSSLKTERRWYRNGECVTGVYKPEIKTIFVLFDDKGPYHSNEFIDTEEVVLHEFGHVFDELLGGFSQSKEFLTAFHEDWRLVMGESFREKVSSSALLEWFADAFVGFVQNEHMLLTSSGMREHFRTHQREAELIKQKIDKMRSEKAQ